MGEIGNFSKGKGVPKDKIIDNGYKCLTYGDIYTKYDIVMKNVKSFIDKKTAKDSQEIQKGNILFASSGETLEDIGKAIVYLDDDKGYAGGDIIIFQQSAPTDSLWLSYVLNSSTANSQKYRMGQGHSVVHIYSSQLEQLKIPFPPLPEQQKIAKILSIWDVAIEKQTQLITQLETRKRGLMQQLLSGEKRLKGFKGKWKSVKLGSIASFFSGGTPNTNISEYFSGKIPFIKSGEIYKSYTEQYISQEALSNSSAKLVDKGDILYALYGATSGECAISQISGAINQAVLCIKTTENKKFIFSILQKNKHHYISSYLQGGQGNLSMEIVKNYLIKLPTIKEQTAISDILSTADTEIYIAKKKLIRLKEQKNGLMQILLKGERRVKQ